MLVSEWGKVMELWMAYVSVLESAFASGAVLVYAMEEVLVQMSAGASVVGLGAVWAVLWEWVLVEKSAEVKEWVLARN